MRSTPGPRSAQVQQRMTLIGDLRRALEAQELILHYQPIVDLATGGVIAAEALIRWNHPNRGQLAPMKFLPAAEASGLILSLGRWVLMTACAQSKIWQMSGLRPLPIGVNLSYVQFKRTGIVETVAATLEETELDASLLDLDITEYLLMKNTAGTIAALRSLAGMGVGISLDDFGTGLTSTGGLEDLPIRTLKIDSSFVAKVGGKKGGGTPRSPVVEAVVHLGHALGKKVLAEGVESKEQADYLRSVGCDLAQGFYFGAPVPSRQFTAILQSRTSVPGSSS